MQTSTVNSASMVADKSSLVQTIAHQSAYVAKLRQLLHQNFNTPEREEYRAAWARECAFLSRLQLELHFAGKEVSHEC